MTDGDNIETAIDKITQGPLDRRALLKRGAVLGLSVPVLAGLITACGDDDEDEPETESPEPTAAEQGDASSDETESDADAEEDETPTESTDDDSEDPDAEGQFGGRLRIAIIGEPPTLDIHQTTATIVDTVTWNMYETLFTADEDFAIIPYLADSYEVSDDGLTNSITLREGVLFHNGEEMLAADVIASFERWAQISNVGGSVLEATEEIVEVDDYSIDFKMSSPLGAFPAMLGRQGQGLAIYPKSVIDASDSESLSEFIGTGPYQFTDRQADSFILISRFEDYVAREGGPNGYGGTKAAYVDEIEFIPVPDEASRIAGLQAGDYDYIMGISADQVETFENDPNVVTGSLPPAGYGVFVLNMAKGMMTDLKIRQAFLAALDCQPIAQASEGEGFYRLDPGFMLKESVWHSTVNEELYNQNDPEKARQLLEEAGYDGTPLRFLTSQEYQYYYNAAVVASQQLEAAGFTVELVVVDWATVINNRSNEDLWDAFTTGFTFEADPLTMPPVSGCTWPGWWCTDEKNDAADRLLSESDFEARYQAIEDIQNLWYTEVPIVKVADRIGVFARSSKLKGIESVPHQLQTEFVNVWLED